MTFFVSINYIDDKKNQKYQQKLLFGTSALEVWKSLLKEIETRKLLGEENHNIVAFNKV